MGLKKFVTASECQQTEAAHTFFARLHGLLQSLSLHRNDIFKLIVISSLFITPSTFASTNTKLNSISHKIDNIQHDLSVAKHHKKHYQQQLERVENRSANIYSTILQNQKKLKRERSLLDRLQNHAQQYQLKLSQEKNSLAKQLRAAYILGRQPYLKLLLNGSSVSRIKRMLTYYAYMTKDQVELIHSMQNTLYHIHHTQNNILSQTEHLNSLQKKQHQQQQQLNQTKHYRLALLKKINQQIQNKNEKLQKLQADKHLLEQTISRLNKASLLKSIMQQNLYHEKAKLFWPVAGKIIDHFGTQISQSELTWSGVLLSAPMNENVYAIAGGQVVFAKWMPGYGLLMIINHGHGFMSLYGRAHSLYRRVGDIVSKGELIASVGESGGYHNPALYFAIRHNAKPLNPERWCK